MSVWYNIFYNKYFKWEGEPLICYCIYYSYIFLALIYKNDIISQNSI